MLQVMVVVAHYLQNKLPDSADSSFGDGQAKASSQCVPCVIVTDKRAAQKSLISKLQDFLLDKYGKPLVTVQGTSAGQQPLTKHNTLLCTATVL